MTLCIGVGREALLWLFLLLCTHHMLSTILWPSGNGVNQQVFEWFLVKAFYFEGTFYCIARGFSLATSLAWIFMINNLLLLCFATIGPSLVVFEQILCIQQIISSGFSTSSI